MAKVNFSFNPLAKKQPGVSNDKECICTPFQPGQELWPIYCDYFNLGDPAPCFTLEGVYKCKRTSFNLKDYLKKWVVLFFYGSDFTFV